jgi:hypothetical protein
LPEPTNIHGVLIHDAVGEVFVSELLLVDHVPLITYATEFEYVFAPKPQQLPCSMALFPDSQSRVTCPLVFKKPSSTIPTMSKDIFFINLLVLN